MKIGNFYQLDNGAVYKCLSRYYNADDCLLYAMLRDIMSGDVFWVQEKSFYSNVVKEYT